MPARIGGELKQLNPNTWEINSKSGRYSSDYSQEEQDIFLNNAVRYKFHVIFPEITFTLQTKI